MKIVFIGAGNLATCVSSEMQRVGMDIVQIYSRTREHAEPLAKKLNCLWTTDTAAIVPNADLYLFAVKDAALPQTIADIPANKGLWAHTAGSLPMNLFKGKSPRYGVFYPLQTFTKGRLLSLDKTPIFVEANTPEDAKLLLNVATALSGNARKMDSATREYLHLAAVFASNFTNHMYYLAGKILAKQDLSYELLLPLIIETARKLSDMPPLDAQTGPARRGDRKVLDKQAALLADEPAMQTIYKLLSQSIYNEQWENDEQHSV